MRVGDKDGLDDIYSEEGELILKEDEELIVLEENMVPSLKTTWRKFGGEDVIDSMNGKFYLTNRRFVFIATPENIGRIGASQNSVKQTSQGMGGTVGGLKNATNVVKNRDYFEFLVKELLGCEISSGVVSAGEQINVYIMSSGEQYRMTFLAREDSELLKRFKNKTVENSDELVSNLKKYFENTDWIYG